MTEARGVYLAALAGIALVMLSAGAGDLFLYETGRPTITDLLRERPTLFLVPLVLAGIFAAGLAIHLYGGVCR